MGVLKFFGLKRIDKEKKEDEVKKMTITKLNRSIYQERIDFLKDKLERVRQKHQELMLEDQIDDLERDLEPEDEEPQTNLSDFAANPEDTMMSSILNLGTQALINRKNVPPSTNPVVSSPDSGGVRTYTDEELNNIIAATPKDVISQIKGLPDAMLTQILKNQYKDADDNTISRAIPLIRKN